MVVLAHEGVPCYHFYMKYLAKSQSFGALALEPLDTKLHV